MATTSSAATIRTPHPSAEFFTSHPPQTTLSFKSLSLTPKPNTHIEISSNDKEKRYVDIAASWKWRTRVDVKSLKKELFEAITPLDRGAEATPKDQERVDEVRP
ncbi:conserved hypothetical protein [Ricinus communis]|uniref:Uncharacterized protein n=1 Tax=Ricinus communis TaxID=3988 RepID=B9SRI8_RICCO|nr:conserved hypothetical protein [Ricinus communis]